METPASRATSLMVAFFKAVSFFLISLSGRTNQQTPNTDAAGTDGQTQRAPGCGVQIHAGEQLNAAVPAQIKHAEGLMILGDFQPGRSV